MHPVLISKIASLKTSTLEKKSTYQISRSKLKRFGNFQKFRLSGCQRCRRNYIANFKFPTTAVWTGRQGIVFSVMPLHIRMSKNPILEDVYAGGGNLHIKCQDFADWIKWEFFS